MIVGPSGRIIAIEPDKGNIERIRMNAGLNNLSNLTILEHAVGEEKSIKNFYYTYDPDCDGGAAWGSISRRPMSGYNKSFQVHVDKLDSMLIGEEKIDFIKIDTEGTEYSVLKGAEKIIALMKPVISFEVNLTKWADMDSSVSNMFGYLKDKGYDLFLPQNGYLIKLTWLSSRIMNVIAIHKERKESFNKIILDS